LPDETLAEQELLDRLDRSLVVGTMVISVLEEDLLLAYIGLGTPGFIGRSRIVWNEAAFVAY